MLEPCQMIGCITEVPYKLIICNASGMNIPVQIVVKAMTGIHWPYRYPWNTLRQFYAFLFEYPLETWLYNTHFLLHVSTCSLLSILTTFLSLPAPSIPPRPSKGNSWEKRRRVVAILVVASSPGKPS